MDLGLGGKTALVTGASKGIGRAGTLEERGNVVAFLASDKASWINGVDFSVDGGGSLR